MNDALTALVHFIEQHNGINSKAELTNLVGDKFGLIRDRSVYYCDTFAIRFSSSARQSFGNTVLSLSALQKFDGRPFIVCLVTPEVNYCMLANSTFLKKISHSSHELRENNIKGSFNGSDILRQFGGIENIGSNLERLFEIHAAIGFDGNLTRLVEATNNIVPAGHKFVVTADAEKIILEAPRRARDFVASEEARILKRELDSKVEEYKNEILLASLIENVNVRGRIIEYLIAGEDERLRRELVSALRGRVVSLPQFKTDNTLGDYRRVFEAYFTETDVKTKIIILNSNPKAYNIDKILEFLSNEKSVFMFYFVGVDATRIVNTVLVSMFEASLLKCTILLRHWAGRNSRGVTQFEGKTINRLIVSPTSNIDEMDSVSFVKELIAL